MSKNKHNKSNTVVDTDVSEPVVELEPQITLKEAVQPSLDDIRRMAITAKLVSYADKMKPGRPISPEECGIQQWILWNTIREILSLEGPEFTQTYAMFLDFVNEHRRGAFSETHVYRSLNNSRMASEEGRIFQRVMNLILATCNRSTRHLGLKQVNLNTTLRGLQGNFAEKIADFYDL